MVALRRNSLPLAFLVGFPIFLAPSVLTGSAPGSPLTEDEYRVFFTSWRPEWKMKVVCKVRRDKGCQDPGIRQLDMYENHGQMPEGRICADFPNTPSFENFCEFAQFRCSNQLFYTKRIPCPSLPLDRESSAPTERSHSILLKTSEQHLQTEPLKEAAPLQENNMLPIKAPMPSPGINIHASVDEILNYAFAASGQRPEPMGQPQTQQSQTLQSLTQQDQTLQSLTQQSQSQQSKTQQSKTQQDQTQEDLTQQSYSGHDHWPNIPAMQEWQDYSKAWQIVAPRGKNISDVRKTETTGEQKEPSFNQQLQQAFLQEKPLNEGNAQAPREEKTQQNFQQVIPETTGEQKEPSFNQQLQQAFLQEKPLNEGNAQASREEKTQQNFQQMIPETKGSLFDLDKSEALVILCFAVLKDNCINSAVSRAWKQVEARTLGYGDSVCDSQGRRHADLCSECAFCSLKTEQCQGYTDLSRVPCGDGKFENYINAGVLNQHQAKGTMVGPLRRGEEFKGEVEAMLQLEYWCGILATYGCEDARVNRWLQSEYSRFQEGDFPEKICDSTGTMHPNYCAFKSYECMQNSKSRKKVLRYGCLKNVRYRVLSDEEGEKEVKLWSLGFLHMAQG